MEPLSKILAKHTLEHFPDMFDMGTIVISQERMNELLTNVAISSYNKGVSAGKPWGGCKVDHLENFKQEILDL